MPRYVLSIERVKDEDNRATLASCPSGAGISITAGGEPPLQLSDEEVDHRASAVSPVIKLLPRAGTVEIIIPLFAHERVFLRHDKERLQLSNDPRLLLTSNDSISLKGLTSFITLGCLMPPHSPWDEIIQLPTGFRHTISLPELEVDSVCLPFLETDGEREISSDNDVIASIDTAMEELLPDGRATVLFSGGIDSTLLAARLAQRDNFETRLVHCQTSPDSRDTQYASKIAKGLGLPMQTIAYDQGAALSAAVENLPKYYLPFSDFTSIAVLQLLETISLAGPSDEAPIIDGTGADGSFASGYGLQKAAYFAAIPDFLLYPARSVYSYFRLWEKPEKRVEDILRKAAKFGTYSGPLGVVVSNTMPLASSITRRHLQEISADIEQWLGQVTRGCPEHVRIAVFGLIGHNASTQQQKCFPFLDLRGRSAVFPYMHPKVLASAFANLLHRKGWEKEDKAPLRRLLERQVPEDLVRRPKQGFSYPAIATFGNDVFLNLFDDMIADRGHALFEVVDYDLIVSLRKAVEEKRRLSWYTYTFLWSCVFGYHWLVYRPTALPSRPIPFE